MQLLQLEVDDGDGDDEPDSKGSANITLLSKSASSIQVKSTGGNETATFEFIVKDSTGTPVNSQNAVTVNFEIAAGPDGGEALFPLSALTESGIAKTTLNSGTKAGVVQIEPYLNVMELLKDQNLYLLPSVVASQMRTTLK